ncbi:MAG: exo-alpha-sialidase [Clostridiaceae bacterium]|nr:exo-alpha-sialidase [Clostridiaceae bacterium]
MSQERSAQQKAATYAELKARGREAFASAAQMPQSYVDAEIIPICYHPQDDWSYYGWPSIARDSTGKLIIVCSGNRRYHVDPWGKVVIMYGNERDLTQWTKPRIIFNSPFDDRDAGILLLDDQTYLVSSFSLDIGKYAAGRSLEESLGLSAKDAAEAYAAIAKQPTELSSHYLGSWHTFSADGGETWSEQIPSPLTTPHGPIRLRNGRLFYFGKLMFISDSGTKPEKPIMGAVSDNRGLSWRLLGPVPMPTGIIGENVHEPYAIELADGKMLGFIRLQMRKLDEPALRFTIMQTESTDGGLNWSEAKLLGCDGSPPHIIQHSSGTLVLVFGCRTAGRYGIRAWISEDDGQTWEREVILCEDAPSLDLGYPQTVELADGSLFTIWYGQLNPGERCSILGKNWRL